MGFVLLVVVCVAGVGVIVSCAVAVDLVGSGIFDGGGIDCCIRVAV